MCSGLKRLDLSDGLIFGIKNGNSMCYAVRFELKQVGADRYDSGRDDFSGSSFKPVLFHFAPERGARDAENFCGQVFAMPGFDQYFPNIRFFFFFQSDISRRVEADHGKFP